MGQAGGVGRTWCDPAFSLGWCSLLCAACPRSALGSRGTTQGTRGTTQRTRGTRGTRGTCAILCMACLGLARILGVNPRFALGGTFYTTDDSNAAANFALKVALLLGKSCPWGQISCQRWLRCCCNISISLKKIIYDAFTMPPSLLQLIVLNVIVFHGLGHFFPAKGTTDRARKGVFKMK